MTAEPRVPAVGGTRTVPEPDAIASDYLLLGLRLDQHVPGLIDAYYGPASLKAQVEIEPKRSPAALRDDAASLRARVAEEIDAPDRRTWLTAQLVALEAQAARARRRPAAVRGARRAGLRLRAAAASRTRLFDAAPRRSTSCSRDGDRGARIDAWDASLEIPEVACRRWSTGCSSGSMHARAALFGLPPGERLSVSLRPQPAVVRLQLVRRRAPVAGRRQHGPPDAAAGVRPHRRPRGVSRAPPRARLEGRPTSSSAAGSSAAALLINTPECFISEGLADLGFDFASPRRAPTCSTSCSSWRVPLAADPERRREVAARQPR